MEEKEGKASRMNLGGNGSLKFGACGSLNYSGARGFERRGLGRDGVNMEGRSGRGESPDASRSVRRR